MTMAVTLDACAVESDSLVRFAAYASVVWGAQALWWEGVGRCAPVGEANFDLVASINRRVAQWAEPLFLKAKDEAVYARSEPGVFNIVRYAVTDVWSTSSLTLPPLNHCAAHHMGSRCGGSKNLLPNEVGINTLVAICGREPKRRVRRQRRAPGWIRADHGTV